MSIEKFNPSITGETIPYVQANTFVIQNITNIEALAVWIYLLTLPKDWEVVKAHIKKHFGLGDNKVKTIFAYLNKHLLIEYIQERGEDGKMRQIEIKVLNGSRFIPEAETAGSITAPPENRTCGKQAPTKNIDKQRKQKEQIIHIPSWLSKESWEEFQQHRREMKKPMSALAQRKIINELSRLKDKGQDPHAVLNVSILSGWSGIFEIKKPHVVEKEQTSSYPQGKGSINTRYARMKDVTQERLDREEAEAKAIKSTTFC